MMQPTPDEQEFYDSIKAVTGARERFAPIHSIRVVDMEGWTRMYRTDGRMVVYMGREVWAGLPKQRWAGHPLIEIPDDIAHLGHRLSAFPVYVEDDR